MLSHTAGQKCLRSTVIPPQAQHSAGDRWELCINTRSPPALGELTLRCMLYTVSQSSQWDEALVAHGPIFAGRVPIVGFFPSLSHFSTPQWHSGGGLPNQRLALQSCLRLYLWEKLGDGREPWGAMVTHHWLSPTGSGRAWEPMVEVKGPSS